MSAKNVWPDEIVLDLDVGFSDAELESLCQIENNLFAKVLRTSRLAYWASEVYGFGTAWRVLTKWPNFMPLPISTDHGVTFGVAFETHELKSFGQYHLTWSRWRASRVLEGKSVIRVQHPWVMYRKKMGIKPLDRAKGTLLFVDHSAPGKENGNSSYWNHYLGEIANLPAKFEVRGLVLHPHDVKAGLHRSLRAFGYPLYTLGHFFSPAFASRFYDLVARFEFVTSASLGSHLFLAEEFGVESFLYGTPLAEYLGKKRRTPWLFSEWAPIWNVLKVQPPRDSSLMKPILEDHLGTDLDPQQCQNQVRRIFLKNLFPYLSEWAINRFGIWGRKFLRTIKTTNRRSILK